MFQRLDRLYDQNQIPEHCHKKKKPTKKHKMIFSRSKTMEATLYVVL